jgi:hypothetical protein
MFLDGLKKDPKFQERQCAQAGNAIVLYIQHFLSNSPPALTPEMQKANEDNMIE